MPACDAAEQMEYVRLADLAQPSWSASQLLWRWRILGDPEKANLGSPLRQERRVPFRGTRARPEKEAKRELVTPSEAEVETLEAGAESWLRAAVVVMARAGLRVGALPSLRISGATWTAMKKGKRQTGAKPEVARKAIARAGLPLRGPFADRTAQVVKDTFRVLAKRLKTEGKLEAVYSAHDLRHAFTVRLYEQAHEIYRVQQALGHATVAVTETYLRSLGLVGG
jgi:integrase